MKTFAFFFLLIGLLAATFADGSHASQAAVARGSVQGDSHAAAPRPISARRLCFIRRRPASATSPSAGA